MKSEEEKFMLFPDSNMIKYHCMVADTEEYHWAYVFTKDKLSQIHFEAFLGSIKNGDDYVAAIKNKYDNHLGPSTSFNLGYRWLTDSVSAIVFNESEEANMGYVRMVFFNTKDSTNTDTLK